MYTPFVRLCIVLLGSAYAMYSYQDGSRISAGLATAGVALTVWGYFTNGTVYLAWTKLKKQQFEKAEKVLAQTTYPQFLKRSQRGYYHFTKALLCMNKDNHADAADHFKSALVFGVRTENNIAIINVNLAEIACRRQDFSEADTYIKTARSLQFNSILEPEIVRIENKIKEGLTPPSL